MSITVSSNAIKQNVAWIAKNLNSPEQRMILGATALATQPFIDYNNKEVDENTRMISVARTLAKIIAGTIVGVVVRHYSIQLTKKFSNYTLIKNSAGKVTKILPKSTKDIFTPKLKLDKPNGEAKVREQINNYRGAAGTLLATFAMVFTNFLIDAPLTRVLTRFFHNYILKAESDKKEVKK